MTDRIERELELAAPADRVWRSLTEPDHMARWLADEAVLEPWPGGEASFRIGAELRRGWVEEVRPPSPRHPEEPARLTFWWAAAGQPASRVEVILNRAADRTRLRIVETRPLEVLDLIGVPLPGRSGSRFGPALVAA